MNHDWLLMRIKAAAVYEDNLGKFVEIEGGLYDLEGFALLLTAQHGPGMGEIVEIGGYSGKSCSWLAIGSCNACREKVTVVAPYSGSRERDSEDSVLFKKGVPHEKCMDNIAELGTTDYIDFLEGKSEKISRDWNRPIRLLFINGDNSYESVKQDFEIWSPHVVQGGMIAFTDIGNSPGITNFYNDLIDRSGEYKERISVLGLRIIQGTAEKCEVHNNLSHTPWSHDEMFLIWLKTRLATAASYAGYGEKLAPVHGGMYEIQGYALMIMAEQGPGIGEIVEIGSLEGKSTCWLGLGTKNANREKVTAVDPFTGSPEHQKGALFEQELIVDEGTTYRVFKENIKKMGLNDYVTPIVGLSEEVGKGWNKPIRLLFIDGDHSYEASKLDFETWSPFVVKGGLIGFHDIGGWPGVTEFYEELLASTSEYKQIAAVMGLNVIQKLC